MDQNVLKHTKCDFRIDQRTHTATNPVKDDTISRQYVAPAVMYPTCASSDFANDESLNLSGSFTVMGL